ncbi:MAG: polysaccharide biosynthesis C-terminal domain-containing protein, partial [Patescibacteria group bacterium]
LCLFTLPMVAGTIILAKPIIALIAGPGYESAAGVLQILIVATGIIFLGSLFTHAIVAVNEQKSMIIYYLIAAIVAVALYIKFIPIYSYYAAAITTVIAELLISLAAFYKVRKKAVFKLSLASFGKTLIASIFMAATIYYLPAWPLVLLIPAGAAVYALVAWFIKAWPHSIHS